MMTDEGGDDVGYAYASIVLEAKHITPKAGRNDDELSWNIMKKRVG